LGASLDHERGGLYGPWSTDRGLVSASLGPAIFSARAEGVERRAHGDVAFTQAAISGLFAALRGRHDAERSVGKVAALLAEPQ